MIMLLLTLLSQNSLVKKKFYKNAMIIPKSNSSFIMYSQKKSFCECSGRPYSRLQTFKKMLEKNFFAYRLKIRRHTTINNISIIMFVRSS